MTPANTSNVGSLRFIAVSVVYRFADFDHRKTDRFFRCAFHIDHNLCSAFDRTSRFSGKAEPVRSLIASRQTSLTITPLPGIPERLNRDRADARSLTDKRKVFDRLNASLNACCSKDCSCCNDKLL